MKRTVGKERRVVVVDDSRTVLAMVETAFSARRDFRVVGVATDALEAVAMVEKLKPDIITIDMFMPYIDGAEMLRLLAHETGLCKIIVSDATKENIKLKNSLIESGADCCIGKKDLVDNPSLFFDRINYACKAFDIAKGKVRIHEDPRSRPSVTHTTDQVPILIGFGYPIPADEDERIAVLENKKLTNAVRERQFDLITRYVAEVTAFPVCLMTFLDKTTQWVKSAYGTEMTCTPRSEAFCCYTIAQDDPLIVTNAAIDPRFSNYPLVKNDFHLRTYVGHPIIGADSIHLGAICVIDTKCRIIPRSVTATMASMCSIVAEIINNRPALAA